MSTDHAPGEPGLFPPTAWTLIDDIRGGKDDPRGASERLLSAYWRPVYCFLRARGHAVHAAEDLTQGFFLRFLEKDWIGPADRARGRFRTFLLTLLTRFVADCGAARAPRQRAFEGGLLSLQGLMTDADRGYEPPTDRTPEAVYMKQWASALVERVLVRLREVLAAEGQVAWHDVFSASHFPPPGEEPRTQEQLAARFGVTRDQIRYATQQAEARFSALLRGAIRDQVGTDAEVGEEVRELLALLAR